MVAPPGIRREFKIMLNYYHFICDKETNFTYSVDMLRLSVYFFRKDSISILSLLDSYFDNSSSNKKWSQSKIGSYSHNYVIGNIYFGVGINSKEDSSFVLFTMEFNPNKASELDFSIINYFLKFFNYTFTVVSCDIAVDIPYNINNLNFFDLNKRTYSVFYKNFDDKTFYFGKAPNRTKIYNKKIESNLDYELTRFEVSKQLDFLSNDFKVTSFNFPIVSFQKFYTDSSDSTDKAIQYALNNGFPFKDLSRTYKTHFRKDLAFNGKIREDLANKVLFEVLHKLFKPANLISRLTCIILHLTFFLFYS